MWFQRLGHGIVRHHKAIIIAWLVAFLVALQFAPLVNDILSYDESAGVEKLDTGSIQAEAWIKENFGDTAQQGSIIVVLRAEDILDNSTKEFVGEAVAALDEASDPHNDERSIGYEVEVQSLYSITLTYTTGYLIQVNSVYYSTYDGLNQTRHLLFEMPSKFRSVYERTDEVQALVFGLPQSYAETWSIINSSAVMPAAAVDALTYAQTASAVQATNDSLAWSYLNFFSTAWNATVGNTSLVNDPASRASVSIEVGFEAFDSNLLTTLPDEEASLLRTVRTNFTMADWNDFAVHNSYSHDLFLNESQAYLAGLPVEQRSLAISFFGLFYGHWSSLPGSPNETEFWTTVTTAVQQLASTLPSENGTTVLALYQYLGWDGYDDLDRLKDFTATIVSQATDTEDWLVVETADLGRNASVLKVLALSKDVEDGFTISDYPVPIVPALVRTFVNVPSNDTMIVSLSFLNEGGVAVAGPEYVPEVRRILAQLESDHPEITTYVTGSDAISFDIEASMNEDMDRIDPITIVLVLVLIGLFFRSFVASAVPPTVIGLGLGISYSIIYFIGSYVMSINYTVLTIMLTSMLGAGCDYCIFILSRYREERRKGSDKRTAVETSVTWAGEAIATSGLTVIIGFGALSLGRLDYLRSMSAITIGVTFALLLALTLLPSVLMLIGDRIFWPAKMDKVVRPKGNGYFTRSAKFSIKHAKAILLAAVLISVPTTYLVFTLETSYDYIESMPRTQAKDGIEVLSDSFGGGKIIPTYVGLQMTSAVYDNGDGWNIVLLDEINNISAGLSALDNVKAVYSPTQPYGERIDYQDITSNQSIEAQLYGQYMRTMVGDDPRTVLITIIFEDEPFTRHSFDTIDLMRTALEGNNSTFITASYLGGSSAVIHDITVLTQEDFQLIIALVIIGIYLILMVVLGSLLNPLRSVLTILLSISWTLAVSMLVFELLFGQNVNWMVPLILLVVCLGLGMDYDILLSTRVREETRRGRTINEAIVHSVEQTGGIITACGIIMAGAFGTMMLSSGWLLREFGFALMFAILLDATIVRIYMVPAIMSLLGKWNWWAPGRLQRKK